MYKILIKLSDYNLGQDGVAGWLFFCFLSSSSPTKNPAFLRKNQRSSGRKLMFLQTYIHFK